jgi:hypothetical protein
MLVFDFETGPQPEEELRAKWQPPDCSDLVETEFDPRSVKLGNLKDPAKIADKIEAARAVHAERMGRLDQEREQRITASWREFVDGAALSAIHGMIIACGIYRTTDHAFLFMDGDERSILERFWDVVDIALQVPHDQMAGHNIIDFDLPFAIQRSWILGVDYPRSVVTGLTDRWLKWHPMFVDTRRVWLLATNHRGSSFSDLARAFGTDGKHDGLDGSQFAELLQRDRERAIEYLREDCRQPAIWLRRMGIV